MQIVIFNLLECMQHQNLSGAMLQYDDINRKGFEGDLVINGFAEFIRNLLVCKDRRTADTIRCGKSLKRRYINIAKNISPSLLLVH